jgi:LacI family transcriptional regulator
MSARKRVTMADVAAHAGVSTTAVSLVLNNRHEARLSSELTDRVRHSLAELGYRPNLTARALSTARTHAIGFVSDFISQHFESALLRGAISEAGRRGLVVVVTETNNDAHSVAESVGGLVDRQVDGLIYAYLGARSIHLPEDPSRTPTVVLNAVPDQAVPYIVADEEEGARRLINELFDRAHPQRVAVIGDRPDARHHHPTSPVVQRRIDAIWAVFAQRGIEPVAAVPCEAWEVEEGYSAARELVDSGVPFDAVVCMNDRIAVSVYRALGEAGIRIPGDVSVVSFDDAEFAQYLDPPLTTLALPFDDMAALAVQLVTSDEPEAKEYLVPMPLRSRASVRQVPPADE